MVDFSVTTSAIKVRYTLIPDPRPFVKPFVKPFAIPFGKILDFQFFLRFFLKQFFLASYGLPSRLVNGLKDFAFPIISLWMFV